MTDLMYLAIVVAFFSAAAGLVRACVAVIGTDAPTAGRPDTDAATAGPAA